MNDLKIILKELEGEWEKSWMKKNRDNFIDYLENKKHGTLIFILYAFLVPIIFALLVWGLWK